MPPCSLLCVLVALTFSGFNVAQKVTQVQSTTSNQYRDITLDCSYETSYYYYHLFWYKQLVTGEMIFLIRQSSSSIQNERNGRYSVTLKKSAKSISLVISASQLEDSGMYFCALQDVTELIFGKGTTLSVTPDIQDPKPAVYQLRDPKSKNNTICLFTDFGSQANMPQSMSDGVFKSNGTVLDMKSMDSKSNGLIVWSKHNSLNCNADFAVNASYPSAEVPCDAKLIEKSFETDMNLNFRNLTVMGLRILLLKVAGFNLLMTLRLWSS